MVSIFNVNLCYLKNLVKNTYGTEDFKVRFKRLELEDLLVPKNNILYYAIFSESNNRQLERLAKHKDITLLYASNSYFFTHLTPSNSNYYVFELIEIEFKNDIFDFKKLTYKPDYFRTYLKNNNLAYNYEIGNYITSDVIGKKIKGTGKELSSTFYDKAEIYANAVDMDRATLTNNISSSILRYGELTLKGNCTLDFGGAVFSENQSSISISMEVETLSTNNNLAKFFVRMRDLNGEDITSSYLTNKVISYAHTSNGVGVSFFYAVFVNKDLNKSFKALEFNDIIGSFKINKIMITPANYKVHYFTEYMKY